MPNYALYYPTIEFQDYKWLCSASLLWDKIYRIVPRTYPPQDSKDIKTLLAESDLGGIIYPDEYVVKVAEKFENDLDKIPFQNASALSRIKHNNNFNVMSIHREKIDARLMDILIAKGKAKLSEEWAFTRKDFGALYMIYLANEISSKNKLGLISDASEAWVASTYFKYDGGFAEYSNDSFAYQLANLMIRNHIPENIDRIPPKKIIKFRESRKDERARFANAIKNIAYQISNCRDPHIIEDIVKTTQKEIDIALAEYKKSADLLAVTEWTGIASVSFPVLTGVIKTMLPMGSIDELALLGEIGIASIYAFASLARQKRKIENIESDYSYLYYLSHIEDYRKFSCRLKRQLNEFIND